MELGFECVVGLSKEWHETLDQLLVRRHIRANVVACRYC